jgi:hypothetical protein
LVLLSIYQTCRYKADIERVRIEEKLDTLL